MSNTLNESLYRVYLKISSHPNRPLDGNRLSFSGEIPDGLLNLDKLKPVHEATHDRFDLGSWSTDLHVGRLYMHENGDLIGIAWEETPQPYSHGMGNNPVEELPDELTPIEEL